MLPFFGSRQLASIKPGHMPRRCLTRGRAARPLRRCLGHADSGFTLRVYTHPMPASEERTRRAIDDLFAAS
ncbi:hypothetical protein ACWENR_02360 [Micromonospora sp. NPDC004336]